MYACKVRVTRFGENKYSCKIQFIAGEHKKKEKTQSVINKKYENFRLTGQPRKRWFGGIGSGEKKETLKVTADEVIVLARDRNSFRRAVMTATF
jgi:hypothetical protein